MENERTNYAAGWRKCRRVERMEQILVSALLIKEKDGKRKLIKVTAVDPPKYSWERGSFRYIFVRANGFTPVPNQSAPKIVHEYELPHRKLFRARPSHAKAA